MVSRSHSSPRGQVLALVLTITLPVLLVACGGSDSDDGAAAGGSSDAAPASSGGGSAPASSNDAAPTPGGDSPGTASNAGVDVDFCPFFKDLFHGVRGSGGPSEVPVDQLIEIFAGLPSQVPDAIRGDVAIVSEAYLPFLRLASELGVEDVSEASPEDRQRLEAASAALVTTEVLEATKRIDGSLVGAC